MNSRSLTPCRAVGLLLVFAALGLAPAAFAGGGSSGSGSGGPPQVGVVQPFQFADDFYRAHGIDPTMTLDHFVFPDAKFPECASDPAAPACRTRLGTSPDPAIYNDVRVVETTAGWRHNGNILFYMAPSKLVPDSFLTDAQGNLTPEAAETRALCEDFDAFLFPKTDPVTRAFVKNPGLPNRRQDNVFETQNGYWSNNQLGCWSLAFVVFDGPELNGPDCQEEIAKLGEENGFTLDGDSPIIQTKSDIEKFVDLGCASINRRAFDGSEGFPWVI